MKKIVRIHREISYAIFANFDKVININKVSEISGYNWRTVNNHVKMMCGDYKKRNEAKQ